MPRFNTFPRNASVVNLKFLTNGGIYKLEKIQQAFRIEIKREHQKNGALKKRTEAPLYVL